MTRRSLARALWLGVLGVGCVVGCEPCGGGVVAELRGSVGTVHRDFGEKPGVWQNAPSGSTWHVGDGLRTGEDSRAELRLPPDGRLRVEADTIVRFSDAPPGEQAGTVDVESGAVELLTGDAELLIDAPTGIARVSKGSRVRIRRSAGDRLGLEVAVGRAHIEQRGELVTAHAGEALALEIGRVEVETIAAAPPAPPEAATEEQAEPEEAPDVPASALVEASAENPELVLDAGESATIHDPDPPIALGLRVRDCAGGAELELRDFRGGGRRVRGGEVLGTRLAAGAYRYKVRCANDAHGMTRATGLVRIVRDAGARSLPRSAPRVSVDADGRRYNVRYQNLLPELRLRWPDAPPAASYTLELRGGSNVITETATTPELRLRSGRVREGEYSFVLRTDTARSPETTLRVALDDSARTAQLTEPKDRSFGSGSELRVSGAALSGSTVRIRQKAWS